MPKNTFNEWDVTAANNTDVGGINIDEGCPAAAVNNALREIMAQIADGLISSLKDTTADKLLLNRAHGLGSLRLQDTAHVIADARDTTIGNGWYGINGPGANTPTDFGSLMRFSLSNTGTDQLHNVFFPAQASPQMWTQSRRAGVWSAWESDVFSILTNNTGGTVSADTIVSGADLLPVQNGDWKARNTLTDGTSGLFRRVFQ